MLRLLLSKRGWLAFSHLVREDTFANAEFRRIYKHVSKLHDSTESDLTIGVVKADLEIQYANKLDTLAETYMALETLEDADEMPHDLAESLVKKYLQRSASYQIAEYVANNADKDDFSISTVADLVAGAVEVSGRVNQTVTDLFASEISGSPDTRPVRYSLGVSRQLVRNLRGGTAPGELFIYLGPPSRGKTAFLCCTGATSAANGLRVLHITLEINTRKVIERYDQTWTALSTDELSTPEGQETARAAREIVRDAGGAVYVIDWSYQNVTAYDIGALVRRMQAEGRPIDMVIVDYLELMAPNKHPGREMRQTYSAIGKETRALAVNLEVPIVTAWQANRGGVDALLLQQSDVSESWDIIKIADTIVGLNQSLEELRNKRMRLNIIKQRESTDRGYVEIFCDLERMVLRDLTNQDHRDEVRVAIPEYRKEEVPHSS